MSFASAFSKAFLALQPSQAELARQKQNNDTKITLGMIGEGIARDKKIQASNDLHKTLQEFKALDPSKPQEPSFKFEYKSPFAPDKPTPEAGRVGDFSYDVLTGGRQPYKPRAVYSLFPEAMQAMPQYGEAEKNAMIGQALDKGVDASIAVPLIGQYYDNRRRELDQKRLDDMLKKPRY